MNTPEIERKCDRFKELIMGFVGRDQQIRAAEYRAGERANDAVPEKDIQEAVRLALEVAKQVILDFHRIAGK
jgi:hypothetical protein